MVGSGKTHNTHVHSGRWEGSWAAGRPGGVVLFFFFFVVVRVWVRGSRQCDVRICKLYLGFLGRRAKNLLWREGVFYTTLTLIKYYYQLLGYFLPRQ
jgi:hypothetical protein